MSALTIVPFERVKHYAMLCAWLVSHGIEAPSLDMLSTRGFVAYADDAPIASTHVYCTDSAFAYLDLVCVRPEGSKYASRALLALSDCAAEAAAARGCTRLVGYTPHVGLARAAKRHGWRVSDVPQTLIMRGV